MICPLEKVTCCYKDVGCDAILFRYAMGAHETDLGLHFETMHVCYDSMVLRMHVLLLMVHAN